MSDSAWAYCGGITGTLILGECRLSLSVLRVVADKTPKEYIVSFRIPNAQAEIVKRMLQEQPIIGINSVGQWFRKVGRDCIAGRLTYKNSNDMLVDCELLR